MSNETKSNILKRGALQKKGKGMFDGWSARYFILKKDGDFAYYSDKACTNWKGNIDLQNVTKIVRKDNRNLVLRTSHRNWYLLSHSKTDLDHWQQLISYIITTENSRKKKKMNILRKPKHAPPPKPQPVLEAKKQNNIPHAFDHESAAAYASKDINITETKVCKLGYLCLWRIANEVIYENENKENDHEQKQTLQILMGLKEDQLCLFGGHNTISDDSDDGPIDCVIRNFKHQTTEILDATIYKQIKQSLSISNKRHMFCSGQNQTTVTTYVYNMDYDYDMVQTYNDKRRLNNELYFEGLYWINWQQIYNHQSIRIRIQRNKPLKCEINDNVCELMVSDKITSYFHQIMTQNNVSHIAIASAPKMSIASQQVLSQQKWQWFDGDSIFKDFEMEYNQKIEQSFLVNPTDIFFLTINNTKYKINLKESTQTNTKTDTVRLLRRISINNNSNYDSMFASNGNILSYNPEYTKQKQKQNELIRYEYMNDNGEWIAYDKELCVQIQIAAVQNFSFTNNKGEQCKINFQLMEETNITNNNQIHPIRKITI